jgi:hypothetical protein
MWVGVEDAFSLGGECQNRRRWPDFRTGEHFRRLYSVGFRGGVPEG